MTSRNFIAGFKHETNTFSTLPTDLAAYRARALHFEGEIVPTYTGTNTEIGGFLAAGERNTKRDRHLCDTTDLLIH